MAYNDSMCFIKIKVVAKFYGLNKTNGSYRPQLTMIVYELEEEDDVEEKVEDNV